MLKCVARCRKIGEIKAKICRKMQEKRAALMKIVANCKRCRFALQYCAFCKKRCFIYAYSIYKVRLCAKIVYLHMMKNQSTCRFFLHKVFDAHVVGAKFYYVSLSFLVRERAENFFVGELFDGVGYAFSVAL